jgi:hypothetical protein
MYVNRGTSTGLENLSTGRGNLFYWSRESFQWLRDGESMAFLAFHTSHEDASRVGLAPASLLLQDEGAAMGIDPLVDNCI